MSESLLDETLRFCTSAINVMCDTPTTAALRARLDVLERAIWSLSLVPLRANDEDSKNELHVLALARLVLELRDDVEHARVTDERISGTWRRAHFV